MYEKFQTYIDTVAENIVRKDKDNIIEGKIIANKGVEGNSSSATKLQTPRKIEIQGAVRGNASFDGSKDVVIQATQANIAIITGTLRQTNGSGGTVIAYPKGFTKNNCIVVSASLDNWEGVYGHSDLIIGTSLNDNGVYVSTTPIYEIAITGTHSVKIVLMKIS